MIFFFTLLALLGGRLCLPSCFPNNDALLWGSPSSRCCEVSKFRSACVSHGGVATIDVDIDVGDGSSLQLAQADKLAVSLSSSRPVQKVNQMVNGLSVQGVFTGQFWPSATAVSCEVSVIDMGLNACIIRQLVTIGGDFPGFPSNLCFKPQWPDGSVTTEFQFCVAEDKAGAPSTYVGILSPDLSTIWAMGRVGPNHALFEFDTGAGDMAQRCQGTAGYPASAAGGFGFQINPNTNEYEVILTPGTQVCPRTSEPCHILTGPHVIIHWSDNDAVKSSVMAEIKS